mmetsp:Transcript_14169/g.31335  ORF Transcript_14169/g.31335 Transcript_14169/m.31335 type:complete len:392 (-) Transcript_14169:315-1490(-)
MSSTNSREDPQEAPQEKLPPRQQSTKPGFGSQNFQLSLQQRRTSNENMGSQAGSWEKRNSAASASSETQSTTGVGLLTDGGGFVLAAQQSPAVEFTNREFTSERRFDWSQRQQQRQQPQTLFQPPQPREELGSSHSPAWPHQNFEETNDDLAQAATRGATTSFGGDEHDFMVAADDNRTAEGAFQPPRKLPQAMSQVSFEGPAVTVAPETLSSMVDTAVPTTDAPSSWPTEQAPSPQATQLPLEGQSSQFIMQEEPVSQVDNHEGTGSEQDHPVIVAIQRLRSVSWWEMTWNRNFTLLHWAAQEDVPELCRYTMARGADPHFRDDSGFSALDYAMGIGESPTGVRESRPMNTKALSELTRNKPQEITDPEVLSRFEAAAMMAILGDREGSF